MNPNLTQGEFFAGVIACIVIACIIFYVACKLLRWLFGPKKPKMTPEEQTALGRIKALQAKERQYVHDIQQSDIQLAQKQLKIKSLGDEIAELSGKLDELENEIKSYTKCSTCGSYWQDGKCENCGATKPKPKTDNIPFQKYDWTGVNQYLYSVAEWGDPSSHEVDDDNILLPWAQQEETKFTVGGIVYEWGRLEDEEEGEPDWWTHLSYTHPILGDLTIINKVNSESDHIFRMGDSDDEELSAGDMSGLRKDHAKAVKQGLTALCIWLKSNESNEQVA